MFVIESAISLAAEQIGVDAATIQQANLNKTGDEFPYGQKAVSESVNCWNKAESLYKTTELNAEVEAFNAKNILYKKGLSFMPVCFGISFTNTSMNQARALVHVYTDGSVSVSTGAIEMGQGVNTKNATGCSFGFFFAARQNKTAYHQHQPYSQLIAVGCQCHRRS